MKRPILVAGLLLVAAPASAFVLPTFAILGKIGNRRAELGFETLVLSGHRGTAENPKAEPITLYVRAQKGYRIDTPSRRATTLVMEGKRWSSEGGATAAPERVRADMIVDFWARPSKDRGGERGLAFLDAFNIDEGTVSYGRHDGRVVWIIGAKPWESEKPQLWIDKDYRVPVRLVSVDTKNKVRTDLRAYGVGSALTGEWFPRRLETWVGDRMLEQLSFHEVRVNAPVEAALFKPPSK